MQRAIVVFPDPDSPTKATDWPARIEKETLWAATNSARSRAVRRVEAFDARSSPVPSR